MANDGILPVFRPRPGEDPDELAYRCRQALEAAPRPVDWAPFRVGVVQLDRQAADAFFTWQEKACDDSFGAAAIRLDRDSIRRGWYVTYLPDTQRSGIPCEVLCLDLTDQPVLPEDRPELAAVLRFLARFCLDETVVWVLAGTDTDPDALAAGLGRLLVEQPG